jgi:putative transposase
LLGLTCRSDAGSQFTSIRYGECLAEIGAVPSIGTIGDYDNALAETVNGYCKSELTYGPARTGPWKTVEGVENPTGVTSTPIPLIHALPEARSSVSTSLGTRSL